MQLSPGPSDRPVIRLPLPGYAKWAVRIWLALFLLSPLLVFFRLSFLQFLVLAAILGGLVLRVERGAAVKPGDLLFRLDDTQQKAAEQSASAGIEVSKAAIHQAR